ncbi:MAG: dTDP-glucose 4,6-dehydratase [Gammaproteobacteria bacterium]
MRIIVTGGAGFIGSRLIGHLVEDLRHSVLNIDKLTYSANLQSLANISAGNRYQFLQTDICDVQAMTEIVELFQPDVVMHLAAESHVDRSIEGPEVFLRTNVMGTFALLEAASAYVTSLDSGSRQSFKFVHVSTDEVFGDILDSQKACVEGMPYAPSSPYAASKASSDLLARAWHRTYGLPVVITNCSNNYGPRQSVDKLIPVIITKALTGREIPIYGDGLQIRDWLFVDDHVRALTLVASEGQVGQTYNIGGRNQITNLEVANSICELLESYAPAKPKGVKRYSDLIRFVKDRPGHDRRYAIDCSKIKNELGWVPEESFCSGLEKTVRWYIDSKEWWGSTHEPVTQK